MLFLPHSLCIRIVILTICKLNQCVIGTYEITSLISICRQRWIAQRTSMRYTIYLSGCMWKQFRVDNTYPMGAISLLYIHGEEDNTNIWLNDFLDCYLNQDDCILCSTLIAQGFQVWIKCIHAPELRADCDSEVYFQPCFLCIKCCNEDDVPYLKECLIRSPYKFITLNLFPWPQSAYYEKPPQVTL